MGLEGGGDHGEVELGGAVFRRLFSLVVNARVGHIGDAYSGGLVWENNIKELI